MQEQFQYALSEVVQNIWNTILGLEIYPSSSITAKSLGSDGLVASLQCSGEWKGIVNLSCSPRFAREAASIMFGKHQLEVNNEDVNNAIGELANVVAGNIKSMLPGECQLSLPSVIDGKNINVMHHYGKILTQMSFNCNTHPVIVTVYECR